MRRTLIGTAILAVLLGLNAATRAADEKKAGPLSGTWQCTAHGFPDGDLPFTMTLQQEKEAITGSISSARGDVEISSGTYKNHGLELHIDTEEGTYVVTGKLKGGQLNGDWSSGAQQKGTWEGKKSDAARP